MAGTTVDEIDSKAVQTEIEGLRAKLDELRGHL